jgi:predicted transcriptional regulator
MAANPPRPTDAELEILSALWSRGPATVRDIHEAIGQNRPKGKSTQYTTVLKLLQIMAGKGLVRRDEKQRAHVYEAACSPEWTRKQLAGDLLRRAFNGSAARMLQGALSARKASKKELAELRQLIDQHEKEAL